MRRTNPANIAFYVLLLFSTISIAATFILVDKIAPLTFSHAVYYCQKTISHFVIALPHSFPSIITLALLSIVLLGITIFTFKIIKMNYLISDLLKDKRPAPKKVTSLIKKLKLENNMVVINSNKNLVFCFGLINPRIYISNHLIKILDNKELRAVLTHEKYHLQNKDSLKILLGQVATSTFFFLPILKDVQKYFSLSKELEADQLTIKENGVKSLQSALSKLIQTSVQSYLIAAPFIQNDTMELRIQNLKSRTIPHLSVSKVRLVTSLIVVSFFLILLNLPVHAMETGNDTHSYFICPFGDQCMMSCKQDGLMDDAPFSSNRNFTPINYTPAQ